MRKIFCLLLILSILGTTTVYASGNSNTNSSDGDFTYLVVGFDDVADNTDVMILVRYISADNAVLFIQIPRDTYISSDTPQNKVNQIYATRKNGGASSKEAMTSLSNILSSSLGIKIDGYIAYTTKAFVNFIDGISGVDLNMPFDLTLQGADNDVTIHKGINHLNGNQALNFVRYRKSYAMGDIGRIDAQKILISSIMKKFKSSGNILKLLMLMFNNKNEIVTNIKTGDVVNLAFKNRGRMKGMRFEYTTLPGQSVEAESGLWYFSVSKYAVQSLYKAKNICAEFDKNNVFCNLDSDEFKNIYFSKKITPRIYDDACLNDIRLYQNSG